MTEPAFDHHLAQSCAHAFHISTGLGCTVSDTEGKIFYEEGLGLTKCPFYKFAGCSREQCTCAHIYGMTESERFGGKYIYLCPIGLTYFVSPIIGDGGTAAKITVGPFIMVDKYDFIDCELTDILKLDKNSLDDSINILNNIPFVSPEKVEQFSNLLFMSVGFMNNIYAENLFLESERSNSIQGQIGDYIASMKEKESSIAYPIEKEHQLLQSISHGEEEKAKELLNELLGAIFLSGGSNGLDKIKSRSYELMVLMSRAAISCGVDTEKSLDICQNNLKNFFGINDFVELCSFITNAMAELMQNIINFSNTKHTNLIKKCIKYINLHFTEKITLEECAKEVYISPAYLSRIFKMETGISFNHYLNDVRIKKAKELLIKSNLKLTEISMMIGYEDQSYFTRVFKKRVGMSPNQYRNKALTHSSDVFSKKVEITNKKND